MLLGVASFACGAGAVDPAASRSGPPLAANQVLSGTATVRLVDLEGGCWALETPTGRYQPLGLPAEFRQDGLTVYVAAHGAPAAVSACMVAPLVSLDTILAR